VSTPVQVTGTNLIYVYIVLGISLLALAIAYGLRSQVLAQSDGTEKMKEIAAAVQEGAAAYLSRQDSLSICGNRLRAPLRPSGPDRYQSRSFYLLSSRGALQRASWV